MPVPPLTLRLEKGSALTHQEADDNLTILEQFAEGLEARLGVALNPDGTLKDGAVGSANVIADGIITAVKLAAEALSFKAGDIKPTASSTVYSDTTNEGWLECNGAAVDRAEFLDLWKALGGGSSVDTGSSPFGNGNGSTTFNLPDFKGRTIVGVGAGAGLTARSLAQSFGAETHLLTTAEMPAHTHLVSPVGVAGEEGSGWTTAGSGAAQTITSYNTGSTGGGGSHANMQPSLAVRMLIKT